MAGPVTLVTGGASGIGRATCRVLAGEGRDIAVCDVNREGAEQTLRILREQSAGNHRACLLDVSAQASWQSLAADLRSDGCTLNGLVNCAGIGRNGDFAALSLADWNAMVAVNLTGTFLGCQFAMTVMPEGGVVVNIASIGAFAGGADIAGYCATKGGVTALTRAVAMYGAPRGIRVCAVAPTYVDSEMLDEVADNFSSRAEMLAGMAELVPIGRVASPEDIARAIQFLMSDSAGMITGTTLQVDGGQLAGLPSRHANA